MIGHARALLVLLLIGAAGCVTATQKAAKRFGDSTSAAVEQLRVALHSPVSACQDQAVPRMTLIYADSSAVEPKGCDDVATAATLNADSLQAIGGFGEA